MTFCHSMMRSAEMHAGSCPLRNSVQTSQQSAENPDMSPDTVCTQPRRQITHQHKNSTASREFPNTPPFLKTQWAGQPCDYPRQRTHGTQRTDNANAWRAPKHRPGCTPSALKGLLGTCISVLSWICQFQVIHMQRVSRCDGSWDKARRPLRSPERTCVRWFRLVKRLRRNTAIQTKSRTAHYIARIRKSNLHCLRFAYRECISPRTQTQVKLLNH